jgi:hypothetical protein
MDACTLKSHHLPRLGCATSERRSLYDKARCCSMSGMLAFCRWFSNLHDSLLQHCSIDTVSSSAAVQFLSADACMLTSLGCICMFDVYVHCSAMPAARHWPADITPLCVLQAGYETSAVNRTGKTVIQLLQEGYLRWVT